MPGPPAGPWNEIDQALLKLPPGFAISVFARDLEGARVLALDPAGNLLVSLTSRGRVVALPDKDGDGTADTGATVLEGLNKPHGLAFGPEEPARLYVAETHQVAAYDYDPERLTATYSQKIVDLPPGGRHFTRSLVFLPPPREHRLLIAVGSSCDVCEEQDWRYAKILEVDVNDRNGNLSTYAAGLRNSGFMAIHPQTGHIWATEMGRDHLGDDLPPDEINLILKGDHYGWPYCYGKRVHDDKFDPTGTQREFCKNTIPSFIDIPAHSAPLGLAFFPAAWPREFRYDLLVAYHGSWNRTGPTGYKVVRYRLDGAGNFKDVEDFITGWLTPAGALGRPVDILIQDDGVIFISDDQAGVVYRVAYKKM
jgi:glucose/arabinose dehydrogenase